MVFIQSYLIHWPCNVFHLNAVLRMKSLWLYKRGLGSSVHREQVKAASGGNPVYSLFISGCSPHGCDWIMQNISLTNLWAKKDRNRDHWHERTLSLFVARARRLLSLGFVVYRPHVWSYTTVFIPLECGCHSANLELYVTFCLTQGNRIWWPLRAPLKWSKAKVHGASALRVCPTPLVLGVQFGLKGQWGCIYSLH